VREKRAVEEETRGKERSREGHWTLLIKLGLKKPTGKRGR